MNLRVIFIIVWKKDLNLIYYNDSYKNIFNNKILLKI